VVGAEVEVSDAPERIAAAQAVVLPGVGAAGEAMRLMRASGLDMALRETVAAGRPLLGICLGMQLFFERLEENEANGLGLLAGDVSLLRETPKLPHMGWNSVTWDVALLPPLARAAFAPLASGWQAYFVHSYVCQPSRTEDATAWTDYGGPICAAVCREALLGVQFHPEKSGMAGVALLRGWVGAVTAEAQTQEARS
jgi:glutamine amidotransferase